MHIAGLRGCTKNYPVPMKGDGVEMVNSRDERCNVLWESFRDRGRNIFTQQEILLLSENCTRDEIGKGVHRFIWDPLFWGIRVKESGGIVCLEWNTCWSLFDSFSKVDAMIQDIYARRKGVRSIWIWVQIHRCESNLGWYQRNLETGPRGHRSIIAF